MIQEFFKKNKNHHFGNTWCTHIQMMKNFQCPCFFPNCKCQFKVLGRFWNHFKDKHSLFVTTSQYTCTAKDCTQTFDELQSLLQHFTHVHGNILFCKKCGKHYENIKELQDHKKEYRYILKEIKHIMKNKSKFWSKQRGRKLYR